MYALALHRCTNCTVHNGTGYCFFSTPKDKLLSKDTGLVRVYHALFLEGGDNQPSLQAARSLVVGCTFPRFASSAACAANKSFADSLLWITSAFEGQARAAGLASFWRGKLLDVTRMCVCKECWKCLVKMVRVAPSAGVEASCAALSV